jgi:hypothetical protein
VSYDARAEVLGILEHGLPPLPSPLVPEQGAAVAAWRGDRHGCVLFTRVINDGMDDDADVAVVERAEDGSWVRIAGGGEFDPDRLARQRPEWAAFDALVASGLTIADFRWVLGIAPERVAAIEVERAGERLRLPIDSPVGAFVIGIEGPGQATLQPLDADDRPVGPSEWA